MPLEIRELHIKAIVGGQAGAGDPGGRGPREEDPAEREQLLRECVDKFLEILKEKEER